MSVWQPFDPRLRLAAAMGWTIFVIILLAALASANLAAREAERRAREDSERLLAQFATQIRHALDLSLETHRSSLQATASQIAAAPERGEGALRHQIEALREQFPEFVWLGVTDAQGRVVAATERMLHNENVSTQPWFREGRQHAFFGDARHHPLSDQSLLPTATDRSPGFMAAVPITQPGSSHLMGVLGARLSWHWVERQYDGLLLGLESHRKLELLLAAADHRVLMGPPYWLGRTLATDSDVSEHGAYLVGRPINIKPAGGLAWDVILRQDASAALARARTTHHAVFMVVFLGGLVAAAAAIFATALLTRRLTVLAQQARAVRQGVQPNIVLAARNDEIGQIGATVADLVGHLQQEKQALTLLNAELDARVAARTARIEQMAKESRHTAVVRERLRLARELHDTLAHSLVALLTQIRVIRKLHNRLNTAELDGELARAEDATVAGLAEARAAIAQMRHNSVCEEGLGAALQELLERFQERSGVETELNADTQAASLADHRAETVFRITEEALHNVERHADANTVKITLQWTEPLSADSDRPARVRVEIADDGIGFDPTAPHPGHYGLQGIREQAELIGAHYELHSQLNGGTRVILEFEV